MFSYAPRLDPQLLHVDKNVSTRSTLAYYAKGQMKIFIFYEPRIFFIFLARVKLYNSVNKLARFVDNETSCCARHNDTAYHGVAQVCSV